MLFLLPLGLFATSILACEDGVDNIIKFTDTTKGKGKVLFHDFEIATYDEHKEPYCLNGNPVFKLPGHFKLHKGNVEVKEVIKDSPTLELALTVEKDSWIIGTVCENGKSKNSFVPDQLCKFTLCTLAPNLCTLLKIKTNGPIDATAFVDDKLIDIGALPIPQLGGDWKFSAKIVQGGKTIAGVQLFNGRQWLTIESDEGNGSGIQYDAQPPKQGDHEEL